MYIFVRSVPLELNFDQCKSNLSKLANHIFVYKNVFDEGKKQMVSGDGQQMQRVSGGWDNATQRCCKLTHLTENKKVTVMNVIPWEGGGFEFRQVYLGLAKCHLQSRAGELFCRPPNEC